MRASLRNIFSLRHILFCLILLAGGYQLMADVPDFSGTWETSYGTMVLVQENEKVEGYYNYGGFSTVEGAIDSQGRFHFTYQEPDASGEGWFDLTENGLQIVGSWRPMGAQEWFGWEGYRQGSQAEKDRWLVILETEWQSSLQEPEYSFGEMLSAWFARIPDVETRHRFIHDTDDLRAFSLEAASLPGEVYLIVAAHGSTQGIHFPSGMATGEDFVEALQPLNNLALLHFSSCDIMAGNLPDEIIDSLGSQREKFLISGYTETVDWGASALIEIYYLNQILENGLTPQEAAASVQDDIDFSGARATRWMSAAGFVWLEP